MRGLVTVRAAVLAAVVAIDADMKKMVRASDACRRLMTIPDVGQLTALAFTAAVDYPERFKRSRDICRSPGCRALPQALTARGSGARR
jgi:transposase